MEIEKSHQLHYPIAFVPQQIHRLWGGNRLHKLFDKPKNELPIGESWEISAVEGAVSVVENGVFQGKLLTELIDEYPIALLGESVVERYGKKFPLLIKFIDAKQDLSIQVHPNDQIAWQRHQSLGKEEMWFIMDAEPDSRLMFGFNTAIDQKIYTEHLNHQSLENILHYEKINKEDVYHITAGRVHAIGKGILLAEIQQSSDITYRLYDFNRLDAQGNLRELHTELALDAIDFIQPKSFKTDYPKALNTINTMVDATYFKTNYLHINQAITLTLNQNKFSIYMVVEGKIESVVNAKHFTFNKGNTFLLPACITEAQIVPISGECKVLQVFP